MNNFDQDDGQVDDVHLLLLAATHQKSHSLGRNFQQRLQPHLQRKAVKSEENLRRFHLRGFHHHAFVLISDQEEVGNYARVCVPGWQPFCNNFDGIANE